VKKLTVLLASFVVSGCSWLYGPDGWLGNDDNDYREAQQAPALVLPSGIDAATVESIYPIPPASSGASVLMTTTVPRPTPLTAANAYDAVRIQRLADESWALVAVAPGQLWPQVRAFLSASGIGVTSVDPTAGLIDTQYVELNDHPLPSRFRFRIDGGIQRNTAELHILQQTQSGEDLDWPLNSDDVEAESTMLRNIAQYIANSADSTPISMVADRSMTGAGRISLEETDNGGLQIVLGLPFNRAWASVEKGLLDSGFRIDDKNRSEGQFYVTYLGPDGEEGEGWFGWLWGDEDDHPFAGKVYRLNVDTEAEQQVRISLTTEQGGETTSLEQQGLLTVLQGNIS